MHRIAGPVRFRKRNTILPPDIFRDFDKLTFWQEENSAAHVIRFARSQKEQAGDAPG